jgi:hypothetical protein
MATRRLTTAPKQPLPKKATTVLPSNNNPSRADAFAGSAVLNNPISPFSAPALQSNASQSGIGRIQILDPFPAQLDPNAVNPLAGSFGGLAPVQPVVDPNAGINQINALADQRRAQAIADLQTAFETSQGAVAKERTKIAPAFSQARSTQDVQSRQGTKRLRELLAKSGVATGEQLSQQVGLTSANQQALSGLTREEILANQGLDTRLTDLSTALATDISSAEAGIESDRLANIIEETRRQEIIIEQKFRDDQDELFRQAQVLEQRRLNDEQEKFRQAQFGEQLRQAGLAEEYQQWQQDESVRLAALDEQFRQDQLTLQQLQTDLDEAFRQQQSTSSSGGGSGGGGGTNFIDPFTGQVATPTGQAPTTQSPLGQQQPFSQGGIVANPPSTQGGVQTGTQPGSYIDTILGGGTQQPTSQGGLVTGAPQSQTMSVQEAFGITNKAGIQYDQSLTPEQNAIRANQALNANRLPTLSGRRTGSPARFV